MKITKPVTNICRHCGAMLPRGARICPDCGQKVKRPPAKAGLLAAAVIVLLAALFAARGSSRQNGQGENTMRTGTGKKVGEIGNIGEVGTDRKPENHGTTADAALPLQKTYRVGDVLQDGDMRITYIASGEYREENEYLQPETGYKYIFLKFAFENTSAGKNRSVSFYSFRCYADGFAAQAYYGGEKDLSATLSPGRSTSGMICFCVPQGAKDIEIEYETNFLTSEKLHFAYEGEKDSGYVLPAHTERNAHAFQPGDIVETNTLRISYLSCEKDGSDNDFFRPAPGCSFYTLTFEFENTGTGDQSVSMYDFQCYADGAGCSSSWHRDDSLSADISGGRKAKGTVTFEVPDEAQTVEAEYEANYWTNDRIVFTVR